MTCNVSTIDRIVRTTIFAVILGLFLMDKLIAPYSYILLAVGSVLLLTSLISFCPLYKIFGVSTCKVKK